MAHSVNLRASLLALGMMLALVGCKPPSDAAYYERGAPQSLLDVSSEVVNLSIAGPDELKQLSSWIAQDQPTRAELYCAEGDIRCSEAKQVLEVNGVPTMLVGSPNNTVALVYERILARDCNPRYVDNPSNPYNAPHAAFGCALSANIVQHVSNKQDFVNPNLSDPTPASVGVAAVGRAYAPPIAPAAYDVKTSAASSAKSN